MSQDTPIDEIVRLPRYKCHKEVHAAKIVFVTPHVGGDGLVSHADLDIINDGQETSIKRIRVPRDYWTKHMPTAGGYFVVYGQGTEDEYESFSPGHVFEGGYTLIPKDE